MQIDWKKEVEKRKEQIISDVQKFLQIKSVLDPATKRSEAPFGTGIYEALNFLLQKGNQDGFLTKNIDGYAGYVEFGRGKESLGILCHVDVVPEGSDWTYDPYGGEIVDGKIYGRGAIDDKGPTIAAYYAMKIVKDLGVPLNRRVRMIIGCDEESDWQCVDYYFKREEMPTVGFAPDADFPIIYAEKGICDFQLKFSAKQDDNNPSTMTLEQFQAGNRLNMVPDLAKAIITSASNAEKFVESFQKFLSDHQLQGESEIVDEKIHLTVKGVSAHGMEPNAGKNASLFLAQFLHTIGLDEKAHQFITFIHKYFIDDTRGIKLGIASSNEAMGELTVNCGLLNYEKNRGGELGINIRYPNSTNSEAIFTKLQQVAKEHSFTCELLADAKPHFMDEKHPLITTLQSVYERQTGEIATLIAIGGGTYARALDAGVAFGPLFPNRADVAHQKDEHIYIEDLLKATAIYAEAIYELAK